MTRVATLLARAGAADRGLLDEADARLPRRRSSTPADRIASVTARVRRRGTGGRAGRRPTRRRLHPDTAVAKAPALSRKRQREIADLYRRGIEAIEAERPDDAVRYWELVWSASPEYENVAEFLKREYLLRGLEAFSHGRFDEAILVWEKARDVDPTDQRTLGYLSRAQEQLARSREILEKER